MTFKAVSLKLPTFWPERAKLWFHQAEAQFKLRNISTDETNNYYLLSSVDTDTAIRVMHLIEKPSDETAKYATIKAKLSTFTLNEAQRADLLLKIQGLADNTPSQLMDSMLALLGDHSPCFLFIQIVMQQLSLKIEPI